MSAVVEWLAVPWGAGTRWNIVSAVVIGIIAAQIVFCCLWARAAELRRASYDATQRRHPSSPDREQVRQEMRAELICWTAAQEARTLDSEWRRLSDDQRPEGSVS